MELTLPTKVNVTHPIMLDTKILVVIGAGGGEINVMCEINKRTVRAYRLNLVPKLVLYGVVEKGFRLFDHEQGVRACA